MKKKLCRENWKIFKESFVFDTKYFRTLFFHALNLTALFILLWVFSAIAERVSAPLLDYLSMNPYITEIPQHLSGTIALLSTMFLLLTIAIIFVSVIIQRAIYSSITEKKTGFWKFFLEISILSLISGGILVLITISFYKNFLKNQQFSPATGFLFLLAMIVLVIVDYLYQNIMIVFAQKNRMGNSFSVLAPLFSKAGHFYAPLLFSAIIFFILNAVFAFFTSSNIALAMFGIILLLFEVWRKIYIYKNLKEHKRVLKAEKVDF